VTTSQRRRRTGGRPALQGNSERVVASMTVLLSNSAGPSHLLMFPERDRQDDCVGLESSAATWRRPWVQSRASVPGSAATTRTVTSMFLRQRHAECLAILPILQLVVHIFSLWFTDPTAPLSNGVTGGVRVRLRQAASTASSLAVMKLAVSDAEGSAADLRRIGHALERSHRA